MSNFAFLADEFAEIHASAVRAESQAASDPRAATFYARRTVELAVKWAYKHDPDLKFPYQDNLSALVHEPSFQKVTGQAVFYKTRFVITLGNQAVHESRDIKLSEATQAVHELFHILFWLARTYARRNPPMDGLAFDPAQLTRKDDVVRKAFTELQRLKAELEARDENLEQLLRDKGSLDDQLKAIRAEVAQARIENEARPDTHDYSESETRDAFIDLLLREAGWALDQARDREFPVTGMPNNEGKGFVDYVLWGDDGKPLAVVEAKRTRRDGRAGQQQAKLYADCLEAQFGQRPVIFYTNGYEHWIWDDSAYPPRQVSGFYKKDELQLLIQRRSGRKPLATIPVNSKIVERYYQTRAISRMAESFERHKARKGLLVMATGSGKTRTVIALVDQLMRAGWVKRALFLADRVALVNQAVKAFKDHLPDSSPVNLVTERSGEGRVYLSTYPTMMGLIDQKRDEGRRFGAGHFDLIIIDEAHRSVYQRYGAIFDYFDSLLVGLTATPKDEIDRNTYGLFDLEDGVPTDAYSLDKAVEDEFLVPPVTISVPLKFQREGIRYDDLSEMEKEAWDMLEWDDEDPPDSVDAQAVNKWLFNTDTVDKVLAHVMTDGVKVAGGDRLGKTIIFAKNQAHADFIEKRFNIAFPSLAGRFARVITFKTNYAQTLIDDFSKKDSDPHIAISVDMLDTGIDVPEVVNLVLFKLIRSKTKFWQIIGRGTRLCPGLFGPGEDKEYFRVFDYCQNLEFFQQNPKPEEGRNPKSLGERLFAARFDLVRALDEKARLQHADGFRDEGAPYEHGPDVDPELTEQAIRDDALSVIREHVSAMNLDNFIVRTKRRSVEKYQQAENWNVLSDETRTELLDDVAPLPAEIRPEPEEAKRFDLLMFSLELALLNGAKNFDRFKKNLIAFASALEEQIAIPAIAAVHPLLLDILFDPWWEGITVPILELVRRRLRNLAQHLAPGNKQILYTNFEDELGIGNQIDLPDIGAVDFARFKKKARHFLREHEDHIAIAKLKHGKPLTPTDIAQLQTMLLASGTGNEVHVEKAAELANGLGNFIRALIGLDRGAVAEAFSEFLSDKATNAQQIEFVEMIIDHLTEKGVMDPALLYESPFIDMAPKGPEQVFDLAKARKLVSVINDLNASASG